MHWNWIALVTAFSLIYYLSAQIYIVLDEYQKFYIHPVIGLYKTFKSSLIMSKEHILINIILYTILYLPITIPYFIIWLIYSICR
jgi:hypothetical protein